MSKRSAGKVSSESEPKLKVLETKFADMRPGQLMVIPTDELIRSVIVGTRKGETLSLTELRHTLATRASAEVACPVTTSIVLKKIILSEWSQVQTSSGCDLPSASKLMIPFWRVVDPSMPLYKKLEAPVQTFIRAQREHEGI